MLSTFFIISRLKKLSEEQILVISLMFLRIYVPNYLICVPHKPVTVAARSKAELSSFVRTLGSWLRIPLRAWMLFCVCVVLCLCSGLAAG
jgi:hypothetical protein